MVELESADVHLCEHGATANDLNLVLCQWSAALPSRVTLIEGEHRLSP